MTYTNTSYSTPDCTGPSTSENGSLPPCTLITSSDGVLYTGQTCVTGLYSASTGATSTTYGGADPCTPSSDIVSQEVYTLNNCVTLAYGAFSTNVVCTIAGVTVAFYYEACVRRWSQWDDAQVNVHHLCTTIHHRQRP